MAIASNLKSLKAWLLSTSIFEFTRDSVVGVVIFYLIAGAAFAIRPVVAYAEATGKPRFIISTLTIAENAFLVLGVVWLLGFLSLATLRALLRFLKQLSPASGVTPSTPGTPSTQGGP